ncbi:MAG TPA: DUF4383 domain-containing protein [Gammaproteobacteria bacterium]|nr:DUF4383 domain-containing protein [Gammaproteobacteria bacterium]
MNVRTFALIYGLVFIVAGLAGFIPGLVTPHDAVEHQLAVEQGAGDLLGLFPVNLLHNLVHLVFGVWGLAVYRSTSNAIGYARVVAVVYALFVIMGFIPNLSTVFGLVPLHGNDIWLHAVLAAGAAYFGFLWHAEPRAASGPAPRGT